MLLLALAVPRGRCAPFLGRTISPQLRQNQHTVYLSPLLPISPIVHRCLSPTSLFVILHDCSSPPTSVTHPHHCPSPSRTSTRMVVRHSGGTSTTPSRVHTAISARRLEWTMYTAFWGGSYLLNPTLVCFAIVSLKRLSSAKSTLRPSVRAIQTHALPLLYIPIPRRRSRRLDRICTSRRQIHPCLCNSTLTSRLQRSYCAVVGLNVQLCTSNARTLIDAQQRRYVLQEAADDSTNNGQLSCFKGQSGIARAHTKHLDAAA
ncbi:hypothetical protein BDN70DRAFT_550437 [Pholiota conissans]|uniref:Uncharacterized protein n=1 Tax=Pholiota conissans TaxID=109636 RepID=A0A9P5YN94_9AGAR|nr:hypothetical protein BDN70DRAFT_550437 [Pholiota conissans]